VWDMCMQCMASAMAAVGGAAGTRSWLSARHFSWLTPRRLRMATAVLMAAALLASSVLVSGSSSAPPKHPAKAVAAPGPSR
jgi:hypothetical protein